jgi:hypothetical protein
VKLIETPERKHSTVITRPGYLIRTPGQKTVEKKSP